MSVNFLSNIKRNQMKKIIDTTASQGTITIASGYGLNFADDETSGTGCVCGIQKPGDQGLY